MSALRGLARNRRAYELFFEDDGAGIENDSDIFPEPEGMSDYKMAAVSVPEDTTVYRLSYSAEEPSPIGFEGSRSGAESPAAVFAVDTDELVDRLLRRLEVDARLYTQELEED